MDPSDQVPPQVVSRPVVVKPPRVYTWNCQYCGVSFETPYYSQRYCNRTHKEYAYRERKRQSVDGMTVNKNSP